MYLLVVDINVIVAIIGIAIAALISYHLAFRSGTFKRVNLIFYPAHPRTKPPLKKYLKLPWLIINSCQLKESNNKLLVHLPLTIENTGKIAAENVVFSISYIDSYSTSDLGHDTIYYYPSQNLTLIKRYHTEIPGGGCQTIYEFPMIPAKGILSFFEILSYDPTFLHQVTNTIEKSIVNDKKHFAITRIKYQIAAKNIPKSINGSFWFISTQEETLDLFLEKNKIELDKMFELYDPKWKQIHTRKYFVPWPYKFFEKLLYPNLNIIYNINFKEIAGYSFIKDSSGKLHSTEAVEHSKVSWGILVIPFSVGARTL